MTTTAKRPPEPEAPPNTIAVQQLRLSDSAELWTSATVELSVRGQKRYIKTELKEIALDGESFDDLSFRCVDLVRIHMLRAVEDVAAANNTIDKIARSAS